MASAGMGDVLTGIVAALLAQGAAPLAASLTAVYVHGAAADRLVAAGLGPVGLTASEVADSARDLLNRR
jgi:NAD(P)H-hydrate repair Nnr-like enzyme with NAD(P)H-hydrate dehydratase domain